MVGSSSVGLNRGQVGRGLDCDESGCGNGWVGIRSGVGRGRVIRIGSAMRVGVGLGFGQVEGLGEVVTHSVRLFRTSLAKDRRQKRH